MSANNVSCSFRLNLDREKDLTVHRYLRDIEDTAYRSKSSFIIDALYNAVLLEQADVVLSEHQLRQVARVVKELIADELEPQRLAP